MTFLIVLKNCNECVVVVGVVREHILRLDPLILFFNHGTRVSNIEVSVDFVEEVVKLYFLSCRLFLVPIYR